ncbi:cora-domain-containing protein [Clavulina sp. PMI_390]|nr:cora-domain-containing protein [Clavulina sp. PMI_390]
MEFARGGGVHGAENFLYEEDEERPRLSDAMHITTEEPEEQEEVVHQPNLYFSQDLLLNHRDPMLDADLMRPMNINYNPTEPLIGSYDSHHDTSHPTSHSQIPPHLPPTQTQQHPSSPPDQLPGPSTYPETVGPANLPPTYQPSYYKSNYDFTLLEDFAGEERQRQSPTLAFAAGNGIGAEIRRRLAQAAPPKAPSSPVILKPFPAPTSPPPLETPQTGELIGDLSEPVVEEPESTQKTDSNIPAINLPESGFVQRRQRKLSHSNPHPRRQAKLAMFEGGLGPLPPATALPNMLSGLGGDAHIGRSSSIADPSRPSMPLRNDSGADRPYRFSFYSNALAATIHARSLSELPAEGQTFEDLFMGRPGTGTPSATAGLSAALGGSTAFAASTPLPASGPPSGAATTQTTPRAVTPAQEGAKLPGTASGTSSGIKPPGARNGIFPNPLGPPPTALDDEIDKRTWWLDVLNPTEEEMKMLSRVFAIHPLTTEDILMEEAREKIELFRNYYFVCFRGFDQDPYSPTHLEPLNMYVVVFREGVLSFHFRPTPHPQNVRRRIKQLKDYINVTSDWISYALIDDITDAFGPLIQNIEYEVDSIDELVLILKDADQSDMLRRIGTCRKKVMGLLRLMGNKADVVKGLAKRSNENWSVAPKSDIGLYLSDIQDHLVTMTQNLNHYEKILSRSHSNYLAQISIEMTDANNQINEVLSKLTALGTVLVPMNLVTGLWGMNVHVPGQDVETGYAWFLSIVGILVAFGIVAFIGAYKLMVSR